SWGRASCTPEPIALTTFVTWEPRAVPEATRGDKTLSLAVQVARVRGSGHPRVDCYPLGWRRLRLRVAFGRHDGRRPNPPARDGAVREPAPGGLVPHAHRFGIVRELPAALLPDGEMIVNDSSGFAMNPAHVPNTR